MNDGNSFHFRRRRWTIGWVLVISNVLLAPLTAFSALPEWQRLPDLPESLGVAGPFVGVHNGALLVAGGANFPQGVPWKPAADGSKSLKTYHDRIYAFVISEIGFGESATAAPDPTWITASTRLAHPLGYGVSIDTDQGVLCIGGEWLEHVTNEQGATASTLHRSPNVLLMRWNRAKKDVVFASTWKANGQEFRLPALPRGVSSACGAKIGDAVYVAGGDCGEGGSGQFLRLDLASPSEEWQWEELPTWPGPPRSHSIGVSVAGKFVLLSGRNKHPEQGFELLADAYCYVPFATESTAADSSLPTSWYRLSDIAPAGEPPTCVMGATATAMEGGKLLVFGGDSGLVFVEREQTLPRRIQAAQAAGDTKRVSQLESEVRAGLDDHAGFSRRVLEYDIEKNKWRAVGELPFPTPVTTTAARWNNRVVLPTGETRPGIRSSAVWGLELPNRSKAE